LTRKTPAVRPYAYQLALQMKLADTFRIVKAPLPLLPQLISEDISGETS